LPKATGSVGRCGFAATTLLARFAVPALGPPFLILDQLIFTRNSIGDSFRSS
jgi:hypothetical protein